MAHVEHYKQADVKRLSNEFGREEQLNNRDGRIDPARTKDNYMIPRQRLVHDQLDVDLNIRVNHIPHAKRKDLNVMSVWVITLPEQLKQSSRDEQRRFFEIAHRFTQERYGKENVMAGYVHCDETTPHIHIPLVPVGENGRISSKNVFTRQELHSYHADLNAVMEKEFGMPGLILNGKTKGKYTVAELKERSRQEQKDAGRTRDLDARENELNAREDSLNDLAGQLRLKEQELQNKASEQLEIDKRNQEKLEKEREELQKAMDEMQKKESQAVQDIHDAAKYVETVDKALDVMAIKLPNAANSFRKAIGRQSPTATKVIDAHHRHATMSSIQLCETKSEELEF